MRIQILVLNYNGRSLLAECLPTVASAASRSRRRCEVTVIDNGSRDDSVEWLRRRHPGVGLIECENRSLCSFNEVVASLDADVAVLLNNDVKLAPTAIDPLVEPLAPPPLGDPVCFMTAPLCWQIDGRTYEGLKTAVRWRWGLVQATARFPGHEEVVDRPDLTASAGAAMAVDCRKFVELGGFDPIYLPGRIEDLDFAYRGFLAGYRARYVPRSVAYHIGMASFGPAFGPSGNDHLALRNTLLFQWKNLRHPAHVARQWFHLPLRLIWDAARAPLVGRRRRWALIRAFLAAGARWRANRPGAGATAGAAREREFFRRFHPQRMRTSPEPGDLSYWPRPFRVDVSEPTAPAAAPLLQRQSAGEAQR